MKTIKLTPEDYNFIVAFTQKIIEERVPEEVDVTEEIIRQTYQPYDDVRSQEKNEQKYAFSGQEEITGFISGALAFLLPQVIFPLVKKIWEELLSKTAEKSVDEMAIKLKNILSKLQSKKEDQELQHQVDLLVPINWKEVERELKKVALENGFPSEIANNATNILISELSEDRLLLGNTVIYVNRKSLTNEDSND